MRRKGRKVTPTICAKSGSIVPGSFDAYHRWLGIPREEQPPNHYRLLGIPVFEDDPEVVENAADQRMAHLRTFQSGQRSALCAKLLNEVSAAKVCLLNPHKKAAYDGPLREALAPRPQPALPVARPLAPPRRSSPPPMPGDGAKPDSEPVRPFEATLAVAPAGARSNVLADARRRSATNYAGVVVAVGLVLILGVVFLARTLSQPVAEDSALVFDWPPEIRRDLQLTIDGEVVGTPDSERWEYTCDAGTHTVEVARPGYRPVGQIVDIEAGERRLIDIAWEKTDAGRKTGGRKPPKTETKPPVKVAEPTESESSGPGLLAELYEGEDFERRIKTRIDRQIDWDWGHGSPDADLPRDHFSIRWTGWLTAPRPGKYTLVAIADDGVRLWVDGKLLLDEWRWDSHEGRPLRAEVEFTERPQSLKVEFNDGINQGKLTLDWIEPGQTETRVIPAEAFFHGKEPPEVTAQVVTTEPPVEPPPEEPKSRLPVPSEQDQQRILAELEGIYKIGEAKEALKKRELAQALFDLSKKSLDRPHERFVELKTGAHLAGSGGDAALMAKMFDALEKEFEIDPLEFKVEGLVALGEEAGDATAIRTFVVASDEVIDQALNAGRYDVAAALADLAHKVCQQPQGAVLRKRAYQRQQQIRELFASWKQWKDALATLEQSPEDPEANLAAGRWQCLNMNDWEQGLPHLAKGSDPQLKALAAAELAAKPTDATGQVQAGDRWWDASAAAGPESKRLDLERARYWYRQASSGQLSSLLSLKIKKRLEEIEELVKTESGGPGSRPARDERFEPGKWVDILPCIEVDRDQVAGSWTWAGDQVTVVAGDLRDWLCRSLSRKLRPGNGVRPHRRRRRGGCRLSRGAQANRPRPRKSKGKCNGLELLDGRAADGRKNPTTRKPGLIQNGRRYRALIGVRVNGQKALIDVVYNGKKYIRTVGTLDGLSLATEWQLNDPTRPGLAAKQDSVKFVRARVRLVAGKATFVKGGLQE